jgi:mono/diheme cytochrome c family protein
MNSRRLLLYLLTASVASAADADPINFAREIRPILSENCFQCHGPDSKARKAELQLDIAGEALAHNPPILAAGQPEKSPLWQRISSKAPDVRMPPPASNRQLTTPQRQLIRRWIAQGAEFGADWSLLPPVRHTVDARNAVDAFILARLERTGPQISPSRRLIDR